MKELIVYVNEQGIQNKAAVSKAFKLDPGKYLLRLTKANKRSLQQNKFYWEILDSYIQPGLRDSGYREIKTKEDAHEFCRAQFLKKAIVNEKTGEVKETIRSTTELTTTEFNEYIESIAQMAAEFLGVEIPSPDQQLNFQI